MGVDPDVKRVTLNGWLACSVRKTAYAEFSNLSPIMSSMGINGHGAGGNLDDFQQGVLQASVGFVFSGEQNNIQR
jgi:hypothetical protein